MKAEGGVRRAPADVERALLQEPLYAALAEGASAWLTLRQSLGSVLRQLERGGEPILVQRGRQPAAVLISLRDYQERFVDREADARRRAVVAAVKEMRFRRPAGRTTLDLLRDLRSGPA